MEHAIISTDLALLGKNRTKFEELLKDKRFDWKDGSHKLVKKNYNHHCNNIIISMD